MIWGFACDFGLFANTSPSQHPREYATAVLLTFLALILSKRTRLYAWHNLCKVVFRLHCTGSFRVAAVTCDTSSLALLGSVGDSFGTEGTHRKIPRVVLTVHQRVNLMRGRCKMPPGFCEDSLGRSKAVQGGARFGCSFPLGKNMTRCARGLKLQSGEAGSPVKLCLG